MSEYTNSNSFDEVFDKVLKEVPEEKFVVYPEPQFSIEELIQNKQMTDNENKTDAVSVTPENILEIPKMPEIITETPDFVEQNQGEIKNIPEITNIPEAAPEVPKIPEVAPEVPNLVKQNQGETEKKELTEEEKRAKLIEALKQSHQRYHPRKVFGTAYKQKRKAKNKMQNKSRKTARKK